MKKLLNLAFIISLLLNCKFCFSQSADKYLVTNSGTRIYFDSFRHIADDTLYLLTTDRQMTFVLIDSIQEYHYKQSPGKEQSELLASTSTEGFVADVTRGMNSNEYESAYGFALAGSICEKLLINAVSGSPDEFRIIDFRNIEVDESREYFHI